MTKKPIFWIVITLVSALSFAFSWRFFTQAFPVLNVDISMSREAALAAATTRAGALKLAPADARSAVRFNTDNNTQNFIELEGGGKDAFLALATKDIYQTLQWEVRFFRTKDAAGSTLYFTPQGKPYGFTRQFPEKDPGAALSADAARRLAESAARRDWGLDLALGKSPFALAEQSFLTRPGGRTDHSFVYERADQRLGKNGEGRVRLSLQVAGDQLSQLRYFVKIPESFERRFDAMRAANETIAKAATMAMAALYGIGGCAIGLILLLRQRFIVARPALKWAGLIALLQGAMRLNQIPSSWFDYDSAIGPNDFILHQVGGALAAFLGTWTMLTISFMAAESLSRKAFGHQPQLWTLWTRCASNSWGVLGRTVGGYLWVGFDLAFIVVFYFLTQRYLGWWSPLESLVDPNILSTPMPWLEPVANALQAGFWEECLFRAVPLAGAALIGDTLEQRYHGRFGGRKTWLLLGLVVEALIFGAAHANYAQQPAYARPVELFLPAVMWGLVYLRFGLLPGIIFHFVFDLLLMSLPIFVTHAPGLGLDRALIIVCGLMPLLMVLYGRWRAGQWQNLPPHLLNAAWNPPPAPMPHRQDNPAAAPASAAAWSRIRIILPLLGIAGIVLILTLPRTPPDSLPLYLERAEAEQAADAALAQRGVKLSKAWQHFSLIQQEQQQSDTFIWREGGPAAYAKLMGNFLPPPVWRVRYARFEGDVAERAEEWTVFVENGIDGRGGRQSVPHIRGIFHNLPEAHAGKVLKVEQARSIAQHNLRERFKREPRDLREVSAIETKLPNRTDWTFTFQDDKNYPLKNGGAASGGAARIAITVAGDEVSLARRFIYVPEEWERSERERGAVMRTVQTAVLLLVALTAIGGIIVSLKQRPVGEQHALIGRQTIGIIVLAFMLRLLASGNAWQSTAMNLLDTTQSLNSQLWQTAITLLMGCVVMALVSGVLTGLNANGARLGKFGHQSTRSLLLPGIGLGLFLIGLAALLRQWSMPDQPRWASVSLLNQIYPALGASIDGFNHLLLTMGSLGLLLMVLRDFNGNFSNRRLPTILLLFLLGLCTALGATAIPEFLAQGLGTGLMLTLLYVLLARFEPKLILIAAIVVMIYAQLNTALLVPIPHAWLYAGLHVAALCLTAAWWLRMLRR
jgi:hypothetical protein